MSSCNSSSNGGRSIGSSDARRIKLVVVGNSCVGKTSLLFAYTEKQFLNNYQTTIFENYAVNLTIEGRPYLVNLFDTAGQEDYSHLRVLSYPQTDAFLLCFSLTDPNSLHACITQWMPEIRKYSGSDTPVLLIGTKEDLHEARGNKEQVDIKAAQRVANEIGCSKFLVCSSLTHRGLKRVFDEAIMLAINNRQRALTISGGGKFKADDFDGRPRRESVRYNCCATQ